MIFGIEIINKSKALKDKERNKIVEQHIEMALTESIHYLTREVLDRTPQGVTNTLYGSITASPEVRDEFGNEKIAVMGTSVTHGIPVEFGTKPHWPPVEALFSWAKEKLGDPDAAYAVRAKIAKEGTEGVHMFEEALKEGEPEVKAIFAKHGLKISTRLMEH